MNINKNVSKCYCCNDSKTHNENQEKLNAKEGPPHFGIWTNSMWVNEPVKLFYCGIVLHLNNDGTYNLEDTTG